MEKQRWSKAEAPLPSRHFSTHGMSGNHPLFSSAIRLPYLPPISKHFFISKMFLSSFTYYIETMMAGTHRQTRKVHDRLISFLVFGNSDNIGKTEVRDREVTGENTNYGTIPSGSRAKTKLSPTNITRISNTLQNNSGTGPSPSPRWHLHFTFTATERGALTFAPCAFLRTPRVARRSGGGVE